MIDLSRIDRPDVFTLIVILTVCAAVGFVLYLPFLLWFQFRRRHERVRSESRRLTPVGVVFLLTMMAVGLAGPVVAAALPGFPLLGWIRGNGGLVRWVIVVIVACSALERALMRTTWFRLYAPPTKDSPAPAPATPASGTLRGRWRIATIRGVPVFMGASLPTGGLLVSAFMRADLLEMVVYCAAYVMLVTVHELGHFAAARALGLRVWAINISGAGGSCLTQFTRGVKDTFLLYAGGLVAQAVLAAFTLAVVAVVGEPESSVAACAVLTFTWVNLVLAAINLVPGKLSDELATDGAVLWDLLLHAARGRPHPLAKLHAASPLFPFDTNLLTIEGVAPPGFQVGVGMFNDDSTPMEFVMDVLQRYLALDAEAAKGAMLRIHTQGAMLFALADRAQADAVADGITREARAKGHVLVCRAVQAPTD